MNEHKHCPMCLVLRSEDGSAGIVRLLPAQAERLGWEPGRLVGACPVCQERAQWKMVRKSMVDLLVECAYQGCSTRKRKNAKQTDLCHDFISTWEDLLSFLVREGRFRWVKRGVWATPKKGKL